jgi:hypothetical protein
VRLIRMLQTLPTIAAGKPGGPGGAGRPIFIALSQQQSARQRAMQSAAG